MHVIFSINSLPPALEGCSVYALQNINLDGDWDGGTSAGYGAGANFAHRAWYLEQSLRCEAVGPFASKLLFFH